MDPTQHIIALGGGGFSMEPGNPLLDEYVLSLARSPRPKVCFVGTASGDSEVFIGAKLQRALTSRPNARGYRVESRAENEVRSDYLGK